MPSPGSATAWWWRCRPGFEEAPDRVRGGESRSASVRNALAAAPEATVAVVHDAARPLVTPRAGGELPARARGLRGRDRRGAA